jgi:zinc transporter 1
MFGVLIHVIGDAINNIGVIASALIIWKAHGEGRYYADPAIGVFISIMIFLTAWPLTRSSGRILLQIAPNEMNLEDVKHDIEMVSMKILSRLPLQQKPKLMNATKDSRC